jgi:2',3'-cyclic-nucleotide 2'-phosphodiesterase (5'-nucleotidase family)
LARRASIIDRYRTGGDAGLIVVDGGDAVVGVPTPKVAAGDLNKADTILRGMSLMGHDGAAVGLAEIAIGPDRLQQVARQTGLPLLCANLIDRRGGHPFAARRLVTTGGVKVGLFAVTEIKGKDKNAATVLRKAGVRLTDAAAAARTQIKALAEAGAEVVVMLAHTGMDRAAAIAKAAPGIHLVVVGRSGLQLSTPRQEGQTYLVEAGRRGMSLGHVELRLGAGWTPAATLVDDSTRHALHAEAQNDVTFLRGRYKDPKQLERAKKDPRFQRLKALTQRLNSLKAPRGTHTLIASAVELNRSVPDHPALKGLVDANRSSWFVPAPKGRVVRGRKIPLVPVRRVR